MDLTVLHNLILASGGFAFDFECVDSEGRPTKNPLVSRPTLISFATGKPVKTAVYAWDDEKSRFLRYLLRTPGLISVVHYGYYDYFVAHFRGVIDLRDAQATLSDSRMIWWALDEEKDLGLKELAASQLGHKMTGFKEVTKTSATLLRIKDLRKQLKMMPKEANKQLKLKKAELKSEGKTKAEIKTLMEWYVAQAEATIRNETDNIETEIARLELLSQREFEAYAADDAKHCWLLFRAGKAEWTRQKMLDKLDMLHENYRQSLLMTVHGAHIDLDKAAQIRKETEDILADIRSEVYDLAKQEFNLSSSIQIAYVLYHDLGITPPKDTPRLCYAKVANEPWAYSSDNETLKLISHPVAQKIQDYRAANTVYKNFIIGLPKQAKADPYRQNRVRVVFNSTGTVTGRWSSSSSWEEKEKGKRK